MTSRRKKDFFLSFKAADSERASKWASRLCYCWWQTHTHTIMNYDERKKKQSIIEFSSFKSSRRAIEWAKNTTSITNVWTNFTYISCQSASYSSCLLSAICEW